MSSPSLLADVVQNASLLSLPGRPRRSRHFELPTVGIATLLGQRPLTAAKLHHGSTLPPRSREPCIALSSRGSDYAALLDSPVVHGNAQPVTAQSFDKLPKIQGPFTPPQESSPAPGTEPSQRGTSDYPRVRLSAVYASTRYPKPRLLSKGRVDWRTADLDEWLSRRALFPTRRRLPTRGVKPWNQTA
jgi:hypothetical protein